MKLTPKILRNIKAAFSAKHPGVPFYQIRSSETPTKVFGIGAPRGHMTYNLATDGNGAEVRELTFNLN